MEGADMHQLSLKQSLFMYSQALQSTHQNHANQQVMEIFSITLMLKSW